MTLSYRMQETNLACMERGEGRGRVTDWEGLGGISHTEVLEQSGDTGGQALGMALIQKQHSRHIYGDTRQ